MTGRLLPVALLLCLAAAPAFAQDAPKSMPSNTNVAELDSSPRNAVYVDYEGESFRDSALDPWKVMSAEFTHHFGFGSVIARVNRAERFNSWGTQFEVDSYPHIMPGMYGYLNFGVSNDSIFPNHRYGGELFKTLGHGFEGSLGFRRLLYGSNVTLYTGSIAKYKGNYYVALRPYVSNDQAGTSVSGQMTLRRYYATGDTYWGLQGSYGKAPTETTVFAQIARLSSWNVRANAQGFIARNTLLYGHAGYRSEEFRVGAKRKSFYAGTGLEFRF